MATRRRRSWSRVVAALFLGMSFALPSAAAVKEGQAAPEFELESTAGTIRLADFREEKNVLLAFYYKDFTGG